MIRKRKWQIGVVALVALLVVPWLIAMGYDRSSGSESESGTSRAAQSYADDYGVSEEEARRRLGLQAEAGELGASLASGEGGTFGGLWVEHTPQYAVKVAFTENGDTTLNGYEMSSALAGVIDVVEVDATLEALLGVQAGSESAVAGTGVEAEYGVIVQENVVDVLTVDKLALERALASKGVALPTKARVKEVSALSAPVDGSKLHGGEHLSTCTSGFAVKNSSGTEGITTAGHCRDAQSRSGTTLTFVEEWDGGSYDLQWHTGPSTHSIRNLAYDGTNHRYINSGRHWDDQSAGDYVCKYGKTTRYDCGEIETKYYRLGPNRGNLWVLVRNVEGDNSDLAEPGDSGGPFFDGNVGVGILTHGVDTTKAVYMAFNLIEDKGLTLDTD